MQYFLRVIIMIVIVAPAAISTSAQASIDLERQILQVTPSYDSVLLYYSMGTRWMPERLDITGVAVRANKVIRLKYNFHVLNNVSPRRFEFVRLSSRRIAKPALIDSVKAISFSFARDNTESTLNSPDTPSRNPDYLIISDGSFDVLYYISRNKPYILTCYLPDDYQKIAPTHKRAEFIDMCQRIKRYSQPTQKSKQ